MRADLARVVADAGAAPVVAAVAPNVDAPANVRVVRTRPQGSPIAAIRLGMAQLTNTVAGAVVLIPLGAEPASLVALLARITTLRMATLWTWLANCTLYLCYFGIRDHASAHAALRRQTS